MKMHEHDRFPEELEGEPDAEELRRVWVRLTEADEATPGASGSETVAADAGAERTEEAWERLSARLELGGTRRDGSEAPPVRPPTARSRRLPLAAAATVLLALGAAGFWHAIPVSHSAPPGGTAAVVLPDGSEALLNAGSTLRHSRGFAWLPGVPRGVRGVRLEGEAFFDVASGARPFEVSAGEARVRVLGTRFNVRARGSLDGGVPVRVDVEEGRVRVALQAGASSVELGAGEGVRVPPTPEEPRLEVETVVPARIASWRTGGLTVTDEPLAVVLAELSARFAVPIETAAAVNLEGRVSVYYPRLAGLESVLDDLATQQGLRVRRTANGWELF